MTLLIEYWDLIVGLFALIVAAVFFALKFIKNPKGKQIKKIREWLIFVCLQAERELGEKTGQAKLRYVYDLFLTRFIWLSLFISFDTFSKLVDEALVTVRKMIESDEIIREYVKGDSNE